MPMFPRAILFGLAATVLGGCVFDLDGKGAADDEDSGEDPPAPAPDADGDGYGSDVDCNDANALVNPGAVEVCDPGDVDEDCNGVADSADRGLTDGTLAYHDVDGDGFGDPTDALSVCEVGSGYVLDATDCDDTDPEVRPGRDELCDAADVDENCDGLADNDDPTATGSLSWFVDADEDGLGDDAAAPVSACDPAAGLSDVGGDCDDGDASVGAALLWYRDDDGDGFGRDAGDYACTAPAGQVSNVDDCNDRDAAVSPDGAEVCGGVDDDCDGLVDDADPSVDLGTGAPWYTDVDGDGYAGTTTSTVACAAPVGFVGAADASDCDDADVAVSPAATEICENGIDDDCDGTGNACEIEAGRVGSGDITFVGEDADDRAGNAVAIGDVDDDGDDDVLIGAYGEDGGRSYSMGAYYALRSPSAGTIDLSTATKWSGASYEASFGFAVAMAGDTNGDGRDDWIVGEPGTEYGVDGSAYVYRGGSSLPTSASVTFTGDFPYCGSSVAGGADVDDDGRDDVITGCLGDSEAGGGAVIRTSYGTHEITGAAASWSGRYAGTDVALMDLTGDGVGDAFVGSPYERKVYLFEGPVTGDTTLSAADATWPGVDFEGIAIEPLGDVTGDGVADLGIGDTDRAWVVPGGSTAGFAAGTGYALEIGVEYVYAMAGGDLNGDGVSDVALGCETCGRDSGWGYTDSTGYVWVVYGPVTSDLDATADGLQLTGPSSSDYFGGSLAIGDVDADGFGDLLVGAWGSSAGGDSSGAAYLLYGGAR